MKEKRFEIGDWVLCDDGIGILCSLHKFYFEDFDLPIDQTEHKKGDLKEKFGIVKVVCNEDLRIKKRFNQDYYPVYSLEQLTKTQLAKVNKLRNEYQNDFEKIQYYNSEKDIVNSVILEYWLPKEDLIKFEEFIQKTFSEMPNFFTFSEFRKEFSKHSKSMDLRSFIPDFHGFGDKPGYSKATVEFISKNLKTRKKERLFFYVRKI